MKLSAMKQVLAAGRIQLTKSLGQNFLHDGNQLRRIVDAAELTDADQVLEVGPGLGPLTERLLTRAGKVLAVEMDRRLVGYLKERFAAARHLELRQDDALDWLRREPADWSRWKLVSNLPYSVASPVLVELARAAGCPERLVATVQWEVAQRIMARTASEEYGVLTLILQLRYEPRARFKIPAACFFPKPDVDSACVTLVRRPKPLLPDALVPVFIRLVKQGFSQRRKMLFKRLREDWPVVRLEAAFAQLGLPPQVRAEEVSLEQFVALTRCLGPSWPTAAEPACATQAGQPGTPDAFSPDEIFDVVNERDEVVGRGTRREVHRLGLMHRAVHVLVYNGRGELFLQKRSMRKDRQPGVWDSSASGHLDAGEDYDTCAVRELREELGLRLAEPPRRLFKLAAGPETDQEHVWVYRGQAEGPFTLPPEEIECGGWFSPEQVSRWLAERPQEFAGAFRVIWGRLTESRPSGRVA